MWVLARALKDHRVVSKLLPCHLGCVPQISPKDDAAITVLRIKYSIPYVMSSACFAPNIMTSQAKELNLCFIRAIRSEKCVSWSQSFLHAFCQTPGELFLFNSGGKKAKYESI